MKLTKSLRLVILRQFKGGDTLRYLANLYGFTEDRIENLVREALIEVDNNHAAIRIPQEERKPDGIDS